MTIEPVEAAGPVELPVARARDQFSELVNRAAFGGQVTYITRGRGHRRAAAVVPVELVEEYEALLDREDARVASERLANVRAGRSDVISAEDVARELGL